MAERSRPGPLAGRTVVVTRPARPAQEVAAPFAGTGARVLAVAAIGIEDPADGGVGLAAALARIDTYDWVVVTSANAADRVAAALAAAPAVRVAAVGPRTADRLQALAVRVDLVPERFTGDDLAASFPSGDGRVLFPAAAGARPTVPDGLAALGWRVDRVDAYRTVAVPVPPDALAAARDADAVVFASPSAVDSWLVATGGVARPALAACIGPVTGAAAADAGFRVLEAEPHTMEGVVAALVAALAGDADEAAR
jgi:uroporphyrinogen-III synthase